MLSAVGVVATRIAAPSDSTVVGAGGGRSVLFLDGQAAAAYEGDADRALDVVHGPLTPDHVLASSAIPVAFPPIQLSEPEQSAGWYVDGGIRLNTPLHPAVSLGATKIVLIAATATTYGPRHRPTCPAGHPTSPTQPYRSCMPPSRTGPVRTSRHCCAPTGWWAEPLTRVRTTHSPAPTATRTAG